MVYFQKQLKSMQMTSRERFFIDIARKVEKELKRHGYDVSEISYYVNEVSNLEMRFTEFQSTLLDMFEELVYNGIRVILCLDEFDYCKNFPEECHFQLLRELSYRPENKIAIVTASRKINPRHRKGFWWWFKFLWNIQEDISKKPFFYRGYPVCKGIS